ncbi:hypothetical protein [Streptomyces viridochromogenes]|nr:hypothetical protein [Streptomyces viridochromogenes]
MAKSGSDVWIISDARALTHPGMPRGRAREAALVSGLDGMD